jgi:hypothetical protein
MGTLRLAKALRRCRLALAAGAALAVLIALMGVYHVSFAPPNLESKASTTGFAVQRVLVDTPASLLGDSEPRGSTGAAFRTAYLGNVVAAPETVKGIAAVMNVEPDEIGMVGAGAAPPGTMSPDAQKAIEASPPRRKYVLTYGEVPGLPLLNVVAAAPTEAAAKALAGAGTDALAKAASDSNATSLSARVRTIGALSSGVKAAGPRKATAIVMALVFFIFWVFAVLLVDRLRRSRRRRGAGSPRPLGAWST